MKKYLLILLTSLNLYSAQVLGTGSSYADILAALEQNHLTLEAKTNGLMAETTILGEKFMAGQQMMNDMNNKIQKIMGNGYVEDTQLILEECFAVEMPDIGLDLNLDFGFCGSEALGRLLDRVAKDFANETKAPTNDQTNITIQCKEYNTFYSPETNNIEKVCIKYYKDDEQIKGEDNEPATQLSKGQMKDLIAASSKSQTKEVIDVVNNINIKDDIVENQKSKEIDIVNLQNKLNVLEIEFNQRYNINEATKLKKSDTLNYREGESDGASHIIPIFNKEKNTVTFEIVPGIEKEKIRTLIEKSYNDFATDGDGYDEIKNFLNNNGGSTPFTNAYIANEYYKTFIANKLYGVNKNKIETSSEDNTANSSALSSNSGNENKEPSSQGEEGYKKANILAQQNISFQLLMLNQQLENQNRLNNKIQKVKINLLASLLTDINKEVRDLKIQNKAYLNPVGNKNIKTNEIIIKEDKAEPTLKVSTKLSTAASNCEYNWNNVLNKCFCDTDWTEKIRAENNANCEIEKAK